MRSKIEENRGKLLCGNCGQQQTNLYKANKFSFNNTAAGSNCQQILMTEKLKISPTVISTT